MLTCVNAQSILDNVDLLNRLRTNPRVEIIDGKYKFKVRLPGSSSRRCASLLSHSHSCASYRAA